MDCDELVKNLPTELRIILLGESGVGKSSIVWQFDKGEFREKEATKEVEYSMHLMKIDNKEVILSVWDTAGEKKYRELIRKYYKDADGALLVYDVTSKHHKLPKWLLDFRKYNKDALIIIVGNKSEEIEAKVVDQEELAEFCVNGQVQFVEVSAKTGENVVRLFRYLVGRILVVKGVLPPPEVQPSEEAAGATAAAV